MVGLGKRGKGGLTLICGGGREVREWLLKIGLPESRARVERAEQQSSKKKKKEKKEKEKKKIDYLLYFEVIMHFAFHDSMQLIAFWEIDLTPSGMGFFFGIFWPDTRLRGRNRIPCMIDIGFYGNRGNQVHKLN